VYSISSAKKSGGGSILQLTNLDGVIDAVHQAWDETVDEIDRANQKAIQDERYGWPRTTHRQNGQVVTTPRNILDTAALLESQSLNRTSNDTFELSWGVDYAAKVHEGETLKNGQTRPARRWTQEAIRGDDTAPPQWQNPNAILDVPAHFTDEFRRISRLN
jgi:hypothetical protein